MAKLSGILKNAFGVAMPNHTISLLSARNTREMISGPVTSLVTGSDGSYSANISPGKYVVTVIKDGVTVMRPGTIYIYRNSPDGSLNDFLVSPNDDNTPPVYVAETIYYMNRAESAASGGEKSASEAAASASAAKESEGKAKTSETNAKNSENNSKASETNANASKNAAAASQVSAKTSETNAKNSENNSKASETNANASKNAAADSASKALASESNAKTSEINSKNSESTTAASAAAAKVSENNSKTSESAAKTSETNAKTSETNAKTSETNANASKTAASASQVSAKTSETNAKTSETNAKSSETAAKTSETNANASKTAASDSASKALASENNAKTSETNSKNSESKVASSAEAAKNSETAAKTSETNAKKYADEAKISENAAKDSMDDSQSSLLGAQAARDESQFARDEAQASQIGAKTSENNSKESEDNAKTSEGLAKEAQSMAEQARDYSQEASNSAMLSEANAKTSEGNAEYSKTMAENSADLAQKQTNLAVRFQNGSLPAIPGSMADAKGKVLGFASADGSPTLFDLDKSDASALALSLQSKDGFSVIGSFNNVDEMRSTKPKVDGGIVLLKSYLGINGDFGGGYFRGTIGAPDSNTVEDGGVNFVPDSKSYYWQRVIPDFSKLTVLDFGAVPSPSIDSTSAILKMHNWSQKNNPAIGIQFPPGNFYMKSIDISGTAISRFRISGNLDTSFGYYGSTVLNIIAPTTGADTATAFTVQARYTEISNIIVNGGSTSAAPNKRSFFKNIQQSGQYLRVNSVRFIDVGGKCINGLDFLDTKISSWYAIRCQDSVIYGTWSGNASGSWDHITAIELTDFNIQSYTGTNPAIDLQRAGQSLIRNGWIEKTTYPGNISNGQWVIEMLSMEDCANPLVCNNNRSILLQKNLQGTSSIDNSATSDRFLSAWEMGRIEMNSYGAIIEGSLNAKYRTSNYRFSNNTGNSQWIEVGKFYIPEQGDTTVIEITGTLGFNAAGNVTDINGVRHGGGKARILIQRKGGIVNMTWEGYNSCPITDVKFTAPYNTDFTLYVKMGTYVRNTICEIVTTSKDRYFTGQCFMFTPSYTLKTQAEIDALDSPSGTLLTALAQGTWGSQIAGMGFNSEGYLIFRGKTSGSGSMRVYVNGSLYDIALTAVPAS